MTLTRVFQSFIALGFGLGLTVTASLAQPAAQQASAAPRGAATVSGAAADPSAIPTEVRRYKFAQLDNNNPVMRLRTTEGRATINFGSRIDEVVTRAVMKIRYTYSPALIPNQSHIRILLNEEIVGVLPVTRENAGKPINAEVEIDPRFVAGFNRLSLDFVGHYATECEDPLHTSLWADVSGTSELELTVQPIALKNDLALVPEPFFDRRDLNHLKLNFVFPAKPSNPTLRAAGVTSSWFGQLAAWRGARFPVFMDEVPRGHAVVFATNDERPAFLAKDEPYTAPRLTVITNPADGFSKLLLVTGRNGNDLKIAVDALVRGKAVLSGASVEVVKGKEEALRKPYDAPNWVRLDRPMKFGELIENPQQLQGFGHAPDTIRVNLRIPPDLFTWRSRGVPVDLKFRYSPPIRASESRLSMSVNDELVQAVNLRASGQGGESARVVLPLLDGGLLGDSREIFIPAFKLGSRNQLQYAFAFTYFKEGNCRDTMVENTRAMIDSDSRIDFSGYPHYAEMPHLGYFATAGFPFTKYADLAQTTVVMPDQPTAHDIEIMLFTLGRMGESTGYPATRVVLASPKDEALLKDRDLLLIGPAPRQALLDKWGARLPAIINGQNRRISQPERSVNFLYDWLGFGTEPNPVVATEDHVKGPGPLAAILGFESPLTSSRSVVAITAVESSHMPQVMDVLSNEVLAKSMHGSAAFIRGDKLESIFAGNTYTLGTLPFWTAIWFPLSEHPILLAIMSVLAVLVFAFALWRSLKAFALRRLRGDK